MVHTYSSVSELAGMLERARRDGALSYGELGKSADIDPSQAFRICKGQFKTLGPNVLKICNALAVEPPEADGLWLAGESSKEVRMLLSEVMKVWDKTPTGARRLIRVLRALKDLSE
jgi:hypothetical protein